jgi:hypothetical protein
MPEGSVGARGIGPRGGERWDEAAVGLGQICMVNVDRIAAQPQGIDDGGDTGRGRWWLRESSCHECAPELVQSAQ